MILQIVKFWSYSKLKNSLFIFSTGKLQNSKCQFMFLPMEFLLFYLSEDMEKIPSITCRIQGLNKNLKSVSNLFFEK